MKRAAIYARVSGDDRGQEGRNLEGQLQICREYAGRQGYEVVAELAEDERGASGAAFDLPELGRLLDLAETGQIEAVIVREIDRLARDLGKTYLVEQQLAKAAVQVEYVLYDFPASAEGNLQKAIYASFAEFERAKITERMVRGRVQKVKAGHVLTHNRPPYGYRMTTVDGKRTFAIHEEEARIVRLIFELYTQGDGENGPMSFYGICKHLTELGIPTPADRDPRIAKKREKGEWCRSTIRLMLRREAYCGTWYYGKKHDKGKNNKNHWIPVEVRPIVSRDTWEAAQEVMNENQKDWPKNLKYDYLLRRRAICDSCGSKMVIQHARGTKTRRLYYFVCPAAGGLREYAVSCDVTKNFRIDYVEAQVWAWIRRLFEEPEVAIRGMRTEQAAREEQIAPLRRRLEVVDREIEANKRKLAKALDEYLDDEILREMLIERKNRLQDVIKSQQQERNAIAARIASAQITDKQIAELARYTRDLGEGLEAAERDFDKRRRLIEELDVTVRLAQEGEEHVIYLSCLVGPGVLPVSPTTTNSDDRNQESGLWLSARLVLEPLVLDRQMAYT